MEVILTTDIKGLGYKNDIVNVKPGYGRNYLIPQSFAKLATTANISMRNEEIKQAAHKLEKVKQDAVELAAKIGELTLTLTAKAGESGKIFGAVTPLQVADALKAQGFDIDRKRIGFSSEIRMLGEYKAVLDLHKEVQQEITLEVVSA
ncbi:50S ribosomal protein L9 [Flammeovirga kamogawensis]|uniref:Large ribosomal subunit protein bL9 n=1 Tax=Flammeovirga kamogawensis TaxID=373891 RepID=A0ABX8GXL7_9BACT|nr:50S ribosomal protein L9 [Flammeovirga kamogawensis]MBB6460813.1 large subunit ribosomal protein L9 [Flammeovirga kamogawensis]QWG08164.1 50S ribosomal protein L9 [Flammeovirga kamogawensis]TRX69967.1 50S ribosomal protein L9 [Flammeovirga kamogawensis]